MSFNVSKCKVIHIGGKDPNYSYKLMIPELAVTVEEKRSWSIMVNSSMKVGEITAYVPRLLTFVLFVCFALKLLCGSHNSSLLKKCLDFSQYWVTLAMDSFYFLNWLLATKSYIYDEQSYTFSK